MKVLSILLLFVMSSFSIANEKGKVIKRKPQSLEDRVRSEFGLDRFEISCEFFISGDSVKPRHSVFYEEMSKLKCIMKARSYLRRSSEKYLSITISHPKLNEPQIIKREELK